MRRPASHSDRAEGIPPAVHGRPGRTTRAKIHRREKLASGQDTGGSFRVQYAAVNACCEHGKAGSIMADIKRSGRRSGAKRAVEQTKPVEGVIPSANPDGLEPHEAAPDKPRSGYKVVGFAPPSTMKPGGMGVGNAGAAIRR